MKKTVHSRLLSNMVSLMILVLIHIPALAQEPDLDEEEEGLKPQRPPFESSWIIENQTSVVPAKGTLEFMIQHRFGTVRNGVKDLWGFYADAGTNIRLGLSYTLLENFGFGALKGPLAIGIGSTRGRRTQDVNAKYGFLQQTRNNRIPVSVTYFGNVAMETQQPREDLPNRNESDRYSFFHQIIIARRFNSALSVQIAPSVSHYNVMESFMYNDHYAVAFAARYKLSAQSAVLVNLDQPLNGLEPIFPDHISNNPQPNFSLGIEVATSSHAFQVFVTNFSSIVPQRNNVFNQNAPWGGDTDGWADGFLIGFNITRLWSF
jgi:hypothetical protein